MRRLLDTLISWGPLGLLVLATVESAGIPNPGGADAVLLVLTIANPGWAWLGAAAAITGSMIGSYILFRLARKGGELYIDRYTGSGRGARFRTWFLRYGLVTVFIPALVPLPFLPMKVFIVCAGAMGVPASRFLLVMLAGRIPRYGGLAYLGAQLGENSTAWVKTHLWHLGGVALALFALLYLLIRLNDRRRA